MYEKQLNVNSGIFGFVFIFLSFRDTFELN